MTVNFKTFGCGQNKTFEERQYLMLTYLWQVSEGGTEPLPELLYKHTVTEWVHWSSQGNILDYRPLKKIEK